MPVDYLVFILPVLILLAAIPALIDKKDPKIWRVVAGGLLAVFVLIYFAPGWVLWVWAQAGQRDAQFMLGNHYQTRLGYNWPDIEARDKWWLEAAKQGHPRSMYLVGYFSIYGTSKYIPLDLVAARTWLEAARDAGKSDAIDALRKPN